MPKITANIVINRPAKPRRPAQPAEAAYLRIEASDGMTYCRMSEPFRGKLRHSYCTWRTESRDPDVAIDRRRMPKAVRDLMRENPAVVEQLETV